MQGASGNRSRDRKSSFPMISVKEALDIVLREAQPLPLAPTNLYEVSSGAILAADAVAPDPLPPFPASIMDGYAVISADTIGKAPVVLEVLGRVTAGVDADSIELKPGQCTYITTGAKLPRGADAVIKVEDTAAAEGDASVVNESETHVTILVEVKVGNSIRPIGYDIKQGEVVLKAGDRITPAEVGLLATCGISSVSLVASPVVGVLSTGDELVEPGEPLSGGLIRDTNRSTLLAYVKTQGATALDLGIARDTDGGLKAALTSALERCDIIVTSGGVSMGEKDLLKPLLESLGTIHFGRMNMKPGKPTTFATVEVNGRKKLVLGVPGNPVSCLVTSHLLCSPAIKRMRGYSVEDSKHCQVEVRLQESLKLDPERPEYHRAMVSWSGSGADGHLIGTSTGPQASCRLLSCRGANALLCLPTGTGSLPKGTTVAAILIDDLPPTKGGPFHTVASGTNTIAAAVQTMTQAHAHTHDHGHSHGHGHGSCQHTTEIKAALLTVSDRASSGTYSDLAGPAMATALKAGAESGAFSITIVETKIVPDEAKDIEAAIKHWVDDLAVDLIITSGGTGFGRRDRTPEAIKPLLDREAPGVVHAIYQTGLQHTPLAVMSRPVAGTRGNTFIVTLPGSVKAVKENMGALVPLIPNIVRLLQGHEC